MKYIKDGIVFIEASAFSVLQSRPGYLCFTCHFLTDGFLLLQIGLKFLTRVPFKTRLSSLLALFINEIYSNWLLKIFRPPENGSYDQDTK